MPSQTNCLRYWDLSSQIRLDDAIALWCNVDPAQLASLGLDTQCMSAKRAALVSASSDARKYVIEIPREVAEAARAKLAADMPKT